MTDRAAGESALPDGLPWDAASIGIALVENGRIEQANAALERVAGRALAGAPVASLVRPEQADAFASFVLAAAGSWASRTFGLGADAAGTPADYVAWVRRRGIAVDLVVEPADRERETVRASLLHLVDEMVAIQRDLQHALADKARAEERVGELEKLLPVCAWCGRIRHGTRGEWLTTGQYLDAEHRGVTHVICESCAAAQAAEVESGA